MAVAATLLCTAASAQSDQTVTISARPVLTLGIAGFGEQPLARSPLQASVFGSAELTDRGVATLGALTKLDASVSDAYNADGYWAMMSVRGYTLDNRFNYRRDGLPINAETAIALDNKDRIELLKGTSGIQAGVSTPGGLVDLVVKRPTGRIASGRIEARGAGSLLAAVDVGERFGAERSVGLRVNAAYEHLQPETRDTQGHRKLLAAAADWAPTPGTLIEAEVEWSTQQQPSVAGFSLLGDSVPDAKAIDPRINLNHQSWNKPVVMEGTTASLRLQQRLGADWQARVHAMRQRLDSDDRTAFPYGVYDASYACTQWCDRYAPDGTFSYWQFVSEGEQRTSDALEVAIAGRARTGSVGHDLHAGVLLTRYKARFNDQIFDLARDPSGSGDVGYGHIDGTRNTLPSFGFPDANTNRDERSTELSLRDVMDLGGGVQLWAGLRHTRLERASQRTSPDSNGSLRAIDYTQSATLPWIAGAFELARATLVYASWGKGLETEVAPNRPYYTNAGQPLPALESRQAEIGIKHGSDALQWSLAAFDIDRPQSDDMGLCDVDVDDSCTRVIDGSARHRGLEAAASVRIDAWTLSASAMWLDAERRGSANAAVNGQRPVNVPRASARVALGWRPAALAGLELQGALAAESDRVVLPYDPGVKIPGWARIDLGARWQQQAGPATLVWRVGVDNVGDRRAWKESPYQFGHAYLYPLAPRTWRASLEARI